MRAGFFHKSPDACRVEREAALAAWPTLAEVVRAAPRAPAAPVVVASAPAPLGDLAALAARELSLGAHAECFVRVALGGRCAC